MPTIICDTCGKPFDIKPSQVGVRRRCSMACKDTRIGVVCEKCGKTFLRPAWHRGKWARSFCSVACSRSPHTADFVGTQSRHPILWERFDTWSADLAYFLGLMLTDGNVRENGAISFVSMDACSTEFVRDFVAPESTITEERTKIGNVAHRWHIWSKPLGGVLGRYGILPRKSLTVRLPEVPDAFIWDFVRGLLDGDGSVDRAGRASFSTGSGLFAADLAGLFGRFDMKATVYGKKRSTCVMLNVPASRQLAALIYSDGCPHLARKRGRFHL